jgi:hypothetical protein
LRLSVQEKGNNIQRVLKITITKVTIIGIQQSSIKFKTKFAAKQKP